ncbi:MULTISPECIES: copper amine oxidase N-terminal domain-containing protein [Paenibacillus]|uniref:copper amine oxidase N-terminal domain-containing protein n=1 Tax=Paenibacillus TaxID=44249 RepID=UPI0022820373|nr:copper amine oxidase N-terminal domain-containing protein [Paenibacillus alvei]MCY7486298.1 copper amine oxidase N-terminal domain-containing protein [Paenibacillus alvei]
MKKWLLIMMSMLVWAGFSMPAQAEQAVPSAMQQAKVYFNGYDISEWKWDQQHIVVPLFAFDDYSYFNQDGSKGKQDVTYKWDAAAKTVWVYSADKSRTIKLIAEQPSAWVNGKKVALDAPVRIIEGHTYVPLRFISEALGGKVKWDAKKKAAIIRTPERVKRDEIIRTGELEAARQEALRLPFVYPNREIKPRSEGFEATIVFPEGEALRYRYHIKDVTSVVAITEDGLAEVVWQGRTGTSADKLFEEIGSKPDFGTSMVYFRHSFPVENFVTYGKMDAQGRTTELGKFDVMLKLRSNADAVISIRGEKRTDARPPQEDRK